MDSAGLLFYNSITILSFCLLVIALIFGLIKYNLLNKEHKWFIYYLVFIFGIEIVSKILMIKQIDNLFLYPYYVGGEFLILSTMFIIGLKLPRKLYIVTTIISLSVFFEAVWLWTNNQNVTSGVGKSISHLIIICLTGNYIVRSIKTIDTKDKFIMIYGGMFLYYTISVFLFLFMDQLITMQIINAYIIWGMNNLFSSILYGVSFYTFLKLK